ncbi:MAG: FG-GAP repeat protein [SAR324 cluster bacterium]|nr:FG-GAP repeat protein [SAR324 cluster bacterium]
MLRLIRSEADARPHHFRAQVVILHASDKQVSDNFGWSVATDGDTALVGAYLEDAGGTNAGAAYFFE